MSAGIEGSTERESAVEGAGKYRVSARVRRCSLKSWVLKIDKDAPVLVALGRSFHPRGTTHEKSFDCLKLGVGTARSQSFDDLRDRVVTSLCESIQVDGSRSIKHFVG